MTRAAGTLARAIAPVAAVVVLAAALSGCVRNLSAPEYLDKLDVVYPKPSEFTVCHGYDCTFRSPVRLDAVTWARMRADLHARLGQRRGRARANRPCGLAVRARRRHKDRDHQRHRRARRHPGRRSGPARLHRRIGQHHGLSDSARRCRAAQMARPGHAGLPRHVLRSALVPPDGRLDGKSDRPGIRARHLVPAKRPAGLSGPPERLAMGLWQAELLADPAGARPGDLISPAQALSRCSPPGRPHRAIRPAGAAACPAPWPGGTPPRPASDRRSARASR